MEPEDEIPDYSYEWVRISENPRPQMRGYYRQDWEGFFLHLDEWNQRGLPNSYHSLVQLSQIYNVPVPIQYKKK